MQACLQDNNRTMQESIAAVKYLPNTIKTGSMSDQTGVHRGYLPYKVCAMAAKRRLFEKPRRKFVVFHFMHIFLPQSTFTSESVPNPS